MKFIVLFFLVMKLFANKEDCTAPQAEISNGIIQASIMLPDVNNGYYRGTRFDWSGVISNLKFSGHDYYGKWFEKYDPFLHDAIMGPVDDFTPAGYNDAKPGDNFLKIGIGVIKKPDDKPYTFSRAYETVNTGKWKVKKGASDITFTHILKDIKYSYRYEKKIILVKDKPVMIIRHSFRNTGTSTIETPVYNHNFFLIDREPVGPAYSATFPFEPEGEFKNDLAVIVKNSVVPSRVLINGESIYCGDLKGFSSDAKHYDIKVENSNAGAGARITCNRPLVRIVFWANHTTFCPEPYIRLKAAPGEEFTWDITYEYFTHN